MPIRVTPEQVMRLFQDANPDASPAQVEEAIATANSIVEERLVTALTPALTYLSDVTLTQIEKYLAAHFLAIIDTPIAREGVSVISESVQQKVDLGLLYTKYGQQAVALDATGTLRDMTAVKPRPPTAVRGSHGMWLLSTGRV
jgi:hypothetical protein